MNAKTLISIIIVNLLIVAIVISTFAKRQTEAVIPDAERPETVSARNYATDSIRIVMDEDLPFNENMNELKAGLSYFNPKDIQQFNEDGWRFILTKELDFRKSEYYRRSEAEKAKITGLTNTNTKIIQIRENKAVEDYTKQQTVLCFAQYVDYLNDYLSASDEFTDLIVEYPDYVECKFAGVEVSEENKDEIKLPLASNIDYFAYTMRDYYINPDYLMKNYPDLFNFFATNFPRPKIEG